MKEERLYITGYMASGKSTFGRALAERLEWQFVDLDEEMERREGKPIPEIMAEKGEAGFRMAESMALKSTSGLRHAVIACGGGTPCYRDNMEFMTLHGMTLWLVASPERIAERILEAGDTRPLASGKTGEELLEFVKTHLRQRQHHYFKAFWRMSGEHLESPEEIARTVDEFLTLHPIHETKPNQTPS